MSYKEGVKMDIKSSKTEAWIYQPMMFFDIQRFEEIKNSESSVTVTGNSDDDVITNSGSNNTISGGAGNDTVTNTGSNNVYVYNNGDGTDIIQGLSGKNRLMINGANVSLTTGENATLTINGGDSDSSAPTLNVSGNVTLNSMKNQTWEVEEGETLTYGSGSSAISLAPENTTAIITSDTYLSASVNVDGGAISLAESVVHTINFNDRIISGNGKTKLTSVNETLATAQVTDSASLNAGTIGGAAYLAVDSVKASWTIGSALTTIQLGSDTVIFAEAGAGNNLTSESDGTKVARITSISESPVTVLGVGNHSNLAVGTVMTNWGFYTDDSFKAIFDTLANASISDFDTNETSTLVASLGSYLSYSVNKNLAIGSNDILVLTSHASSRNGVTVEGGLVKNITGLTGNWTVRGGSGEREVTVGSNVLNFEKSDIDNIYGVITPVNYSAGVSGIDSLSGNVTVSGLNHSALEYLKVMDNTWTISGTADSVAIFDSTGFNASVTAGSSTVNVSSSSDATVAVTGQSSIFGGSFNGKSVQINDSDNFVKMELDTEGTVKGIAAIDNFNGSATVSDSLFSVNHLYTIERPNAYFSTNTQFSVGDPSSPITIQGVNSGSYSVTGGNYVYDFDITENTLLSGLGVAYVTLNGVPFSIREATPSLSHAVLYGSESDVISTIKGVRLNDTINTTVYSSGDTSTIPIDSDFTVVYDSLSSSLSGNATIAANNVKITLGAGGVETGTPVTLQVANSTSTMPSVTLNGIANNSTLSVSSGIYHVGQNKAVTVNDSTSYRPGGYLYIDGAGNQSPKSLIFL